MEKEKVRYANRLNERAGEHRRKHNSSPSDIYISSDSTNYIVSRFTKSAHGYVHSFNGFQYMNSVPQWIINTPFSEQKSCVVTYGPIQTFNHLKRETRERTKKRKNAHQRDVYHRENDSPRSRLTRVCSVLRWRRSVLSFFSRKPTTLKNQKNQSRNTNALVTKINQRRRLSLRLFVHDDIDAFPSR